MPNKSIVTVYEYSNLYKKDLPVKDLAEKDKLYQALVDFHGKNKTGGFPYYSLVKDGVRFKQFVGVLCVGNLIIEVLPKADRKAKGDTDKEMWRDCLLHMLKRVYSLEVKNPSQAPQKISSSDILDIFIRRFLNEVDTLLNRGLVKSYHKEEKNLNAWKGKLLWHKQLSENCTHKERFYVNYVTYDHEHVMNCILRQTLMVITEIAGGNSLRGHAASTLFNFPELKEIAVTNETFSELSFNRKTEDYKCAMEIAELILLHYMPNTHIGKRNILALMFDMNKLWEEFIFRVLKRGTDYFVSKQSPKVYWRSTTSNSIKTIRPDIVLKAQGETFVLDTKWKLPDMRTPSDGDLHQMYAYYKRFNAEKVALLYPKTNSTEKIIGQFCKDSNAPDGYCDMLFLPCEHRSPKEWEASICIIINDWIK